MKVPWYLYLVNFYFICVGGYYFYKRNKGEAASFFLARVEKNAEPFEKLLLDCVVLIGTVGFVFVIFYREFFA